MKYRLLAVVLAACMGLGACSSAVPGMGEASQTALQPSEGSLSAKAAAAEDGGTGQENARQGAADQGEAAAGRMQDGSTEDEESGTCDVMEVHFIDVGQGDATLIKCGGENLLIDAGTSDKGTAIQNYLTKQGVEKLDYLIFTHPDSDHIGAAPVVITKFEIGQVLISNFEKDNSTYRKMIQALDDKRLKASVPEVGSTFTLGSAVCTVLAPNRTYDDPNNASVVLLVQNGENRFLFTGDAEEEAEEDLLANGLDLQADVYKAGHHGSRSSSSEGLLDAVDPEAAVISCAEGNSYGHPHAQTLNSLRSRDVKVYRTDEQGSLIASSDGREITWNAAPSETWQAGEPTGSGSQSSKPAGNGTDKGAAESAQKDPAESVQQTGQQDAQPQESIQVPEDNQNPASVTYVLNIKTKKFHKITCGSLPTANRQDTSQSREEIMEQGYEPCKKCNP